MLWNYQATYHYRTLLHVAVAYSSVNTDVTNAFNGKMVDAPYGNLIKF